MSLKLNVDPSFICLHSPQLDSLHLVTSNFFCCLNYALVNNIYIYMWKGNYIDEKEVIQRTEQFEME